MQIILHALKLLAFLVLAGLSSIAQGAIWIWWADKNKSSKSERAQLKDLHKSTISLINSLETFALVRSLDLKQIDVRAKRT